MRYEVRTYPDKPGRCDAKPKAGRTERIAGSCLTAVGWVVWRPMEAETEKHSLNIKLRVSNSRRSSAHDL